MTYKKHKFDSLEHEVLYEYLMVNEMIDKADLSKLISYGTFMANPIRSLEYFSINTGDFPIIHHKHKRFGCIFVFIKRCIRKFLRWYINPIIERQNRYNTEVLNIIKILYKNIEEISAKVRKLPIDYNQEFLFNQYSFAINYLRKGFSTPEDNFTWTDQETAEINIPISLTKTDLKLTIRGEKLTPSQTIEIIINNRPYGEIKDYDTNFIIKADEISGQNHLNIMMNISKSHTPRELGLSEDTRTLGFALIAIALYECDSQT